MTFKELVYSNEDINDKLDNCRSINCCKGLPFRLKSDKFNPLRKDVQCSNKIKRGPYLITKDFSYTPAVLTIKKNNKLHSTIGPAVHQNENMRMFYLHGVHVSKTLHRHYGSDIYKRDFFNKIRLYWMLLKYYAGAFFWKENTLYALGYSLLYIFWISGLAFIYLIMFNAKLDLIALIASVLFTWQTFKILRGTIKSFENVG